MLRGFLGPVDRLHVPGHLAPVLVGAQGQPVAHEMDDAGLDLGLGEDCVDRFWGAQRWASPPLRPSTTAIRQSLMPRALSSFMTRSQNLAPSLCSIHSPRISLVPSRRMPIARCTALLRTDPSSRILTLSTPSEEPSEDLHRQAVPPKAPCGSPSSCLLLTGLKHITRLHR